MLCVSEKQNASTEKLRPKTHEVDIIPTPEDHFDICNISHMHCNREPLVFNIAATSDVAPSIQHVMLLSRCTQAAPSKTRRISSNLWMCLKQTAFGCILWVIVLLEDPPTMIFRRPGWAMESLVQDFSIFPSKLCNHLVPLAEKTTLKHNTSTVCVLGVKTAQFRSHLTTSLSPKSHHNLSVHWQTSDRLNWAYLRTLRVLQDFKSQQHNVIQAAKQPFSCQNDTSWCKYCFVVLWPPGLVTVSNLILNVLRQLWFCPCLHD